MVTPYSPPAQTGLRFVREHSSSFLPSLATCLGVGRVETTCFMFLNKVAKDRAVQKVGLGEGGAYEDSVSSSSLVTWLLVREADVRTNCSQPQLQCRVALLRLTSCSLVLVAAELQRRQCDASAHRWGCVLAKDLPPPLCISHKRALRSWLCVQTLAIREMLTQPKEDRSPRGPLGCPPSSQSESQTRGRGENGGIIHKIFRSRHDPAIQQIVDRRQSQW